MVVPTNHNVYVAEDAIVFGTIRAVQLSDTNQTLTVHGSLISEDFGIEFDPDGSKDFKSTIKIGATGSVNGNTLGITVGASSGSPSLLGLGTAKIENAGSVSATQGTGVRFLEVTNANMVNSGTITALAETTSIGLYFKNVKIANCINSGTISGSGLGLAGDGNNGGAAVWAISTEKLSLLNTGTIAHPDRSLYSTATIQEITNHGTMIGDVVLANSSSSSSVFDNSGTIVGDVELRGGDDVMTNTGVIQGTLDLGNNDDSYHASGGGFVSGQVSGGTGNDTITAAGSDDVIDGGSGNDVVNAGSGADVVLGGAGNDIINGGEGDDTLSGDGDADAIRGGSGSDSIDGGKGDDTLMGGIGDDILNGGEDADILRGGSGADLLSGGSENDNVAGGGGDDTVDGGTGDDKLYGGNGDDEIYAGAGKDVMRGNAGSDTFIFVSVSDSTVAGADRIRDFQSGVDLIDISAITGFTFVGSAAFSGTESEVRYQTTNSGLRFEMDVDGDGLADMRVNMNGISDLVATDFIL